MQSIQLHEHLAEPMAEVLSILNKEFDYPQLTEAILRYVLTRISYTFTHRWLLQ